MLAKAGDAGRGAAALGEPPALPLEPAERALIKRLLALPGGGGGGGRAARAAPDRRLRARAGAGVHARSTATAGWSAPRARASRTSGSRCASRRSGRSPRRSACSASARRTRCERRTRAARGGTRRSRASRGRDPRPGIGRVRMPACSQTTSMTGAEKIMSFSATSTVMRSRGAGVEGRRGTGGSRRRSRASPSGRRRDELGRLLEQREVGRGDGERVVGRRRREHLAP